jgi:hypothetical protein
MLGQAARAREGAFAAGYTSRLVEIPGADHTGILWSKEASTRS